MICFFRYFFIFYLLFLFSFLYSESFDMFKDYNGDITSSSDNIVLKNKGSDAFFSGNVNIKDNKNNLLMSDDLIIKTIKDEKHFTIINLKKAKREFIEFDKNELCDILISDTVSAKKCFLIYDNQNKILKYAKLDKKIVLFREKKNLEKYRLTANKLLYDLNKKMAFIDDILSIDFIDKNKDEYSIYCDKIIWDLEKDIIKLYGKPVIYQKKDLSYILKSNLLTFLKESKTFVFTENPILLQKDYQGKGQYKADIIKYNVDNKKLDFIGNVDIEYIPVKKEDF